MSYLLFLNGEEKNFSMIRYIFFAYESGHHENIDAIKKGSLEYNTHQKTYHVQTWEDLRVGGTLISSTILEAIDRSEIFACDLTYLNHNVLFELGYAIAKKKELLLLLNDSIANAKENYADFKILKNIGYEPFTTSRHINSALQRKANKGTILIEQLVNINVIQSNIIDIFFINSKIENQASLDLDEYLRSLYLSVITNHSSEVEYQTLIWYITNLVKAKSIILHMVGNDKVNSKKSNSELSLFAGIGFGLGKEVLIIAPKPFSAPIDYSDILVEYQDSADCIIKVKAWIRKKDEIKIEKPIIQTQKSIEDEQDIQLNLLKLGIGYEIAEEEEEQLLNYFIEIESYSKALNRTSSFIIGRKGSGKTALFIKLVNDFSQNKNDFIVSIKPDSDELLDNIEFARLFDNERSKKAFLLNVWRFVIYSKLLCTCIEKILSSGKIDYSEFEEKILLFYKNNKSISQLNFYGAINYINKTINHIDEIKDKDVLSFINTSYIFPLKQILQEYFTKEKYIKIHILADNLDKSWDSKNDLTLQSEMILVFLEYMGKIKSEIENNHLELNSIVFLRKDIYDYILRNSREPDKITIKTTFIEWSNYPNKLKALVEERFRFSLELPPEANIESIWQNYFLLSEKNDPFEEILRIIVPRPRDIIYFVSRLFESAINQNLLKVEKTCFDYAVEEYSNFLHNNLIAEMKAEFPEIVEIMSNILKQSYNQMVEYNVFNSIFQQTTKNRERNSQIIHSLFERQYMIGLDLKRKVIYTKYDTMIKKVNERILFIFKKNHIYINLHPKRTIFKQYKINDN